MIHTARASFAITYEVSTAFRRSWSTVHRLSPGEPPVLVPLPGLLAERLGGGEQSGNCLGILGIHVSGSLATLDR
jgi:hypothetical protein